MYHLHNSKLRDWYNNIPYCDCEHEISYYITDDPTADLLSDHFERKQSREAVDLLLTCHPSPSLTTFAFRSSEVRRLLLDLDP